MVFKLSRERSKKTEAVFLVGSRESEGKSKSPQALFLLPAFSFGEAKENAVPQSLICTAYQPFARLPETPKASPMRGSCRRRRLTRWTTSRQRKYFHLIRLGSTVPPSPRRGRFFYAHSRQLYHFSYTQLSQIKYHISNMANMTIMIWNFRAFFHVRSGLE